MLLAVCSISQNGLSGQILVNVCPHWLEWAGKKISYLKQPMAFKQTIGEMNTMDLSSHRVILQAGLFNKPGFIHIATIKNDLVF